VTAFKSGQSADPTGRPKLDPALKALAKGYTVQAIETLRRQGFDVWTHATGAYRGHALK